MTKKWIVDLALTGILLLLMGYSLMGEAIHEWLGLAMLLLLLFHHGMNLSWYRSFRKRWGSPYQCVQTVLHGMLLFAVLGSMVSGLGLSQHALGFLPPHGGQELARMVHLPCAYWGFLLMSLHLGLHWSAVMGMVRRITGVQTSSKWRRALLRLLAAVIALDGLCAFFRNGLPDYLFMRTHFLFFPPDQTILRFLADYLAILALFACAGYYGGLLLRRSISAKTVKDE